ncbi:protein RecA [Mycolicibacterium sp. BK634]|nr:protein RecA [Mycolicibacterium sp. BK634]
MRSQDLEVQRLINNSSLGTEGVRDVCARVPEELAEYLVNQGDAEFEELQRSGEIITAGDAFAELVDDRVVLDMMRYAIGVLDKWLVSGTVWNKVVETLGRPPRVLPHQREMQLLQRDPHSRMELINDVVNAAAARCMRDEDQGRGWNPHSSTSPHSWFIAACLSTFPNEFTRWRRRTLARNNLPEVHRDEDGWEGFGTHKNFSKVSVMRLNEKVRQPISVIPTGLIALDVALGVGGLPRGRVVEIYGPESSGKTTVALHAVASAQAQGGIAAFIDAAHELDPEYAEKLGVDTDALLVSRPDTSEQALEIADMLVRSGALDILVIDSVAALVPRAEIEGEMGDSHVGLQARLMSQALRKMTGALNNSGTTAIFINQLREKAGVIFGSPETTTGGRALKFYASVRLDVRRIETLKDGTDAVGNRTRVTVVKNKVSPPFKQAEFDILYGKGISREGSLIDMGVEQGFIRKSGSWFTYEGEQLGQGKENARNFMMENPDVANEIEKKIKEKLGIGSVVTEEVETVPASDDYRDMDDVLGDLSEPASLRNVMLTKIPVGSASST